MCCIDLEGVERGREIERVMKVAQEGEREREKRRKEGEEDIPANWSTFLGTLAAMIPAPRGAGTRRTVTDPHFPVTY